MWGRAMPSQSPHQTWMMQFGGGLKQATKGWVMVASAGWADCRLMFLCMNMCILYCMNTAEVYSMLKGVICMIFLLCRWEENKVKISIVNNMMWSIMQNLGAYQQFLQSFAQLHKHIKNSVFADSIFRNLLFYTGWNSYSEKRELLGLFSYK